MEFIPILSVLSARQNATRLHTCVLACVPKGKQKHLSSPWHWKPESKQKTLFFASNCYDWTRQNNSYRWHQTLGQLALGCLLVRAGQDIKMFFSATLYNQSPLMTDMKLEQLLTDGRLSLTFGSYPQLVLFQLESESHFPPWLVVHAAQRHIGQRVFAVLHARKQILRFPVLL